MISHWSKISVLLLSLIFFGAACKGSGPADGGVFKSEDVGETWQHKVFVGQQKNKRVTISTVNVQMLTIDPVNPSLLYLSVKPQGLYVSDSGGDQWRKLNPGVGLIRDIEIDPVYPNNIYLGKERSIMKTVNSGEEWTSLYTDPLGGFITQIVVDWYDQQRIFASTSLGTILLSEDEGLTWKVIYQFPKSVKSLFVSPRDSRVMYSVVLNRGVFKTIDGGITWEKVFTDEFLQQFPGYEQVRQFIPDPNNFDTLYLTSPQGILKTIDGGLTWSYVDTLIKRGSLKNNGVNNLTIVPGDPQSILFTVGKVIHKTIDGGITWKTIENFPSSRTISQFIIHPYNPQIIYSGVLLIEPKKKGLF